jgi:serine/threonine-protein kinase
VTADLIDPLAQLQLSLGDRYVVERELDAGGVSSVFLAREAESGRQVVVKVLSAELAAGDGAAQFVREMEAARALNARHIVPLLAVATTVEGLPYWVSPYVDAESLRARIQRGSLATGETVTILRDVARALAHAHERGIVHGDLRPERVLSSGGASMVTGFGVAQAERRASGVGRRGEPTADSRQPRAARVAYLSPEQASGAVDIDHRADIYAWGVMAYEMLAGRHPFGDRPERRMLAAHIDEIPEPLSARRPTLSATLAALVTAALAKDPALRPASARALVDALEDPDLFFTPPVSPPEPATEELPRDERRESPRESPREPDAGGWRWGRIAAAVGVVLLMIAVAVGVMVRERK